MNQVCHAPPLTVEAKYHTIFCCLSGLAKDRSDLWLIKSAYDIKSADFMVLQNCNTFGALSGCDICLRQNRTNIVTLLLQYLHHFRYSFVTKMAHYYNYYIYYETCTSPTTCVIEQNDHYCSQSFLFYGACAPSVCFVTTLKISKQR